MERAWQILRDAGLPLAAPASGQRPAADAIGRALQTIVGQPMDEREREAVAALIFAWRQEWPSSFAAVLRASGGELERWAAAQLADDNRYLKLRRIAIENLSTVL